MGQPNPSTTLLRAAEADLAPLNIGPTTAYHRAQNRRERSVLVAADKLHDDDDDDVKPMSSIQYD